MQICKGKQSDTIDFALIKKCLHFKIMRILHYTITFNSISLSLTFISLFLTFLPPFIPLLISFSLSLSLCVSLSLYLFFAYMKQSSLLRTKVDPEANVVMISSPKGMAGKPLGDLNPKVCLHAFMHSQQHHPLLQHPPMSRWVFVHIC